MPPSSQRRRTSRRGRWRTAHCCQAPSHRCTCLQGKGAPLPRLPSRSRLPDIPCKKQRPKRKSDQHRKHDTGCCPRRCTGPRRTKRSWSARHLAARGPTHTPGRHWTRCRIFRSRSRSTMLRRLRQPFHLRSLRSFRLQRTSQQGMRRSPLLLRSSTRYTGRTNYCFHTCPDCRPCTRTQSCQI